MFDNLFSKRGLSLDRLKSLIEVAEAGSIAEAVNRDHVRQSQYSRQIKELEEFFGIELTRKKSKNIVLTSAGEELVSLTKSYLLSLEDYKSNSRKIPRRFSIGAGDSLHTWLVSPVITQISRENRPWLFALKNLRNDEIALKLMSMDLDIGILRKSSLVSDILDYKTIKSIEYGLYAPKELIPEGKSGNAKWVLENRPLATLAFGSSFHSMLHTCCHQKGIHFKIAFQTQSFTFALRLLREKSCAAILPCIAEIDLNEDFTRIPAPFLESLSRDIVLAWNPRLLKVRPAAEALIDYFQEHIK